MQTTYAAQTLKAIKAEAEAAGEGIKLQKRFGDVLAGSAVTIALTARRNGFVVTTNGRLCGSFTTQDFVTAEAEYLRRCAAQESNQ